MRNINIYRLLFTACFCLMMTLVIFGQDSSQKQYSSPDDAMNDLVTAVKSDNMASLKQIFGPHSGMLIPEDARDQKDEFKEVAENAIKKTELVKKNDSLYNVKIGTSGWTFPVPIVKHNDKWMFDTEAGVKEVAARYIGANEMDAAEVCKAYSIAQWDYLLEGDWDSDMVSEFAQKMVSDKGSKNGLYWPTSDREKESPLGVLAAAAGMDEASIKNRGGNATPAPFHGYYYRILKSQGAAAPGGAYSYLINGNMIGGFAMVAYPAEYGKSGIMSFIVNQQGRVYEKNLGSQTASLAASMTAYNPDKSWRPVLGER